MVFDKPLCRGRGFRQHVGRADRAAQQLSAAIGADPVEHSISAILAKSTFKRTTARGLTVWWQIHITTFAIGF
mgnify:CR=1 FL=1